MSHSDFRLLHSLQTLIHTCRGWIYGAYKNVWIQRWMRLGHAAKGVVYGLVGLLVLGSLVVDGREAGASKTVLLILGQWFFGRFVLLFVAIGLSGYTLWRMTQAILNVGHFGEHSVRRWVQRLGYAVSGLTYLGVAYTALRLAIGFEVDLDDSVEDAAFTFLEWPFGAFALLGISLCVISVGLVYIYGALSGSFISDFRNELAQPIKPGVKSLGKVGFTARGVSFALIGTYLAKSAYHVEADSAGDLDEIFVNLAHEPFGTIWLVAIAFGFISYAIYMIAAAYYRSFPSLRKSKHQRR